MGIFGGGGGCYSSRVVTKSYRVDSSSKSKQSENDDMLVSEGTELEKVDKSALGKLMASAMEQTRCVVPECLVLELTNCRETNEVLTLQSGIGKDSTTPTLHHWIHEVEIKLSGLLPPAEEPEHICDEANRSGSKDEPIKRILSPRFRSNHNTAFSAVFRGDHLVDHPISLFFTEPEFGPFVCPATEVS